MNKIPKCFPPALVKQQQKVYLEKLEKTLERVIDAAWTDDFEENKVIDFDTFVEMSIAYDEYKQSKERSES